MHRFTSYFLSRSIYFWLILLILVVSGFFKFYNYPLRYGFDYDAARDAIITNHSVDSFSIPLIGPPSSQGDFSFGPWYYYLLILGSIFIPTVYAPWIVVSIASLATILVYYKVGEVIRDKTLGLILASFFGLSSSQIILSTGLSNPNFIPFFAAVAFLIFFLYLKKEIHLRWILIWGLVMGIGLFMHYQMVGLLLLPVVAFLYKRKNIVLKILLFAVGLMIAYIPIFIFDINNNWYILNGVVKYFFYGSTNAQYVPNRWLFYLRDFWPDFWSYTFGYPKVVGVATLTFTASIFFLRLVQKKNRNTSCIIFASFWNKFSYF